jgi:hypothetical protein
VRRRAGSGRPTVRWPAGGFTLLPLLPLAVRVAPVPCRRTGLPSSSSRRSGRSPIAAPDPGMSSLHPWLRDTRRLPCPRPPSPCRPPAGRPLLRSGCRPGGARPAGPAGLACCAQPGHPAGQGLPRRRRRPRPALPSAPRRRPAVATRSTAPPTAPWTPAPWSAATSTPPAFLVLDGRTSTGSDPPMTAPLCLEHFLDAGRWTRPLLRPQPLPAAGRTGRPPRLCRAGRGAARAPQGGAGPGDPVPPPPAGPGPPRLPPAGHARPALPGPAPQPRRPGGHAAPGPGRRGRGPTGGGADRRCQPAGVLGEYRDDSAEQLAALVEARLQGRTPETTAAEETPVLNLLDALRPSVTPPVPAQTEAAGPANGQRRKKAPRSPPDGTFLADAGGPGRAVRRG